MDKYYINLRGLPSFSAIYSKDYVQLESFACASSAEVASKYFGKGLLQN